MPATLPDPLALYFAATNNHDIDAMLAPFAEDAIVKDEGQERQGRAAIRAWMEETTSKYRATAEPINIAGTDSNMIVTSRVSGTFPGSPVELRFAFTLAGGKIAHLEIR